MEEELQKESSANQEVETISSVETSQDKKLEDLPRLEDLIKSEKEVKKAPAIEGVKHIEQEKSVQDRVFTRKSDEKKVLVKKRLKIVTAVYTSVVALMLAFVGINLVTLAMLDKEITTNTNTIQTEQVKVEMLEEINPLDPTGEIQISLNEPRDYSDDKKELTFLDKMTILFRNIFG